MIKKLKALNKKLINYYKDDNANLRKQLLIQKLLEEPECFFKMKIETAYALLKDLNIVEEDIKKIYLELIDIKNYKEQ